MKLADKPCYPSDNRFITGTAEELKEYQERMEFVGLTFRERLIVALASNSESFYTVSDVESILTDRQKTAIKIIELADAIIKQLEKNE